MKIFFAIFDFEVKIDQSCLGRTKEFEGTEATAEQTLKTSKKKSVLSDGDNRRQIKELLSENVSFVRW